MKIHRSFRRGFTLIELLVVIAIIAILAALAIPQIQAALIQAQLIKAVSNAKAIHVSITRMALDNATTPDPKIGWPGDLTDVSDAGALVERLVEYKYLDRGDLRNLFTFQGIKAYPGTGAFSSENSAFKFYKATSRDSGQVILIATKNFTFGKPLDAQASPFGDKGAVIFHKGGDGVKINDIQAMNSGDGNLGLMPGAVDTTSPGVESDVLK